LSPAKWDGEEVRDDLRDYVVDAFGDPGAILILDETGDVKKGLHLVGVQRRTPAPPGASRTPKSRCI
jgi:SRSO17 transposase